MEPIEWRRRVSKTINISDELIAEPDLAPNAAFYIERSDIEAQRYAELLQPGALVRIKAPHLMGKTWFIERVLAQFNQNEHYRRLDVEIDRQALTSSEDFYQWLCVIASEGLDLPGQLDTY